MDNNWEIFEVAPESSVETYELIKKIYAKDGPVENVYRRWGMKYKNLPFLIYKNGRLYVDKDLEKKTVPQTIRNIVFSGLIKIGNWQELFEKIKKRLEENDRTENREKKFLDDYQIIFEINLKFEKVIKMMEMALVKERVKLISLLTYGEDLVTGMPDLEINWDKKGLKGNSIELDDTSKFVEVKSEIKKCPKEIKEWFGQLTEFKKRQLTDLIRSCLIYSKLRERGRWLMVKDLAGLKKRKIVRKIVKDRRMEYLEPRKVVGVAVGKARGILVDEKMVTDEKYKGKDKIIYCEVAKPELTEILGQAVGVVTNKGGMMSHLAIVAREMGIPMVVGFDGRMVLGKIVEIDGERGDINT